MFCSVRCFRMTKQRCCFNIAGSREIWVSSSVFSANCADDKNPGKIVYRFDLMSSRIFGKYVPAAIIS